MKTYITTVTIIAKNGKRQKAVNRITAINAGAACDIAKVAAQCGNPGPNSFNTVARLATTAELAV